MKETRGRKPKLYKFRGEKLTLNEIRERTNCELLHPTFRSRVIRGMNIEVAILKPPRPYTTKTDKWEGLSNKPRGCQI